MHVDLAGFSPALAARLVRLLGSRASCEAVPVDSVGAGAGRGAILAIGDALDGAARQAACLAARRAPSERGIAVVLVAPFDPSAEALALAGLVDAVIDPSDPDARIAAQVQMLATRAAGPRLAEAAERHVPGIVADTAPILLWMADTGGACTFANAAYLQFAGVAFEALRGLGWRAFIHPDDLAQVELPGDGAPAGRDHIYRLRRHDGAWRWMLDRSAPCRHPDGTLAGMVGACTDITDVRQAEQDSRVARDLAVRFAHAESLDEVLPACLAAALDVAGYDHGGIYLRDPDGALRIAATRNASDALRESLKVIQPGSERMAIVERGEPVFTDYDKLPFAPDPVALAEGMTGLAILPLHHQDDVVGLLLLGSAQTGAVAPSRRGQLEAIAAQMSTALARLQAEDALARSERLLRTVVEQSPIAIWTLRPDASVGDVWNRAAEQLFQLPRDEATGRPCPACAPPAGDAIVNGTRMTRASSDVLARLLSSQTVDGAQLQRTRRDGSLVEILLYATPLRARGGDVTAAVVIGVDVTDRKQIEARLVRAQKQESLGALAGGLAHDFNNMLTGILGYLDLARDDVGDPAHPVLELIGLAEDTARRATQVTRQMLAYSGGGTFVIEALDLAGVVSQTVPLLTSALRKATLVTELDPDLPPIEGDAGQLRQLLINLVTNAAESLVDATGAVTVRARAQALPRALAALSADEEEVPPGHYVVLTVADTGAGIDPRIRARIFDPFFSTKFVGRGLGLPAVLGIVRGHRGYLRVESAAGHGTIVRVFLPESVEEDETMITPLDPVPLAARRRVLLVDDEPGVLYVASQALARAGFDVLTATTGREALACVGQRPDDIGLVILDLTMPELDGRETLIELRKVRPSLRVVLTSGYSEQEALREVGDGALAGFLQKPFGPRTLIDCVTRAIGLPEAE